MVFSAPTVFRVMLINVVCLMAINWSLKMCVLEIVCVQMYCFIVFVSSKCISCFIAKDATISQQMPRKYKRKTNKGNWTADTLKRAIHSVCKKEMSIRTAAQRFNIPFTTLQNRLKNNNDESAKFGRKAVLSSDEEKIIVDHLIKLSRMFYGLTKVELQRTVYSYVMANNIRNPFSTS